MKYSSFNSRQGKRTILERKMLSFLLSLGFVEGVIFIVNTRRY